MKIPVTCLRFALCMLYFLGVLFNTYAQDVKKVKGKYSEACYRKSDNTLYAIGFESFDGPKYLNAIDYRFARILHTTPVPKNVYNLRLSKDESVLYLFGGDTIFRYNFDKKSIDQTFALQLNTTSKPEVLNLSVFPNSNTTLLAQISHDEQRTLAIYDNGIRRPQVVTDPYAYRYPIITPDGTTIYCANGGSSFSTISRLEVSPNGLNNQYSNYDLFHSSSGGITYFEDKLVSSEGSLISIEPDKHLKQIGWLDIRTPFNQIQPFTKMIFNDPTQDTIFLHVYWGNSVNLIKYSKKNYQFLERKEIGRAFSESAISKFFPIGNPYTLATINDDDLCIMRNCQSAIDQPPAFAPPLIYKCKDFALTIKTPENYPDDRYVWQDGATGHYNLTSDENNKRFLSCRVMDEQGCLSHQTSTIEISPAYSMNELVARAADYFICEDGYTEIEAKHNEYNVSLNGHEIIWADGQKSKKIIVTKPGSYTFKVRTPEGCMSKYWAAPATIESRAAPTPQTPSIELDGDDGDGIICSEEMVKIIATPGFTTYIWSDIEAIGLTNTRPVPLEAKLYVIGYDHNGCRSNPSNTIEIVQFKTPPKPKIYKSGKFFASSSAKGNQWFVDGIAIPGANNQYFTAIQKGNYSVQVTLSAGCPSAMSEVEQY